MLCEQHDKSQLLMARQEQDDAVKLGILDYHKYNAIELDEPCTSTGIKRRDWTCRLCFRSESWLVLSNVLLSADGSLSWKSICLV